MSKNWAICIGINEYEFVGKLKYAQRDAQEMSSFCQGDLAFDKVYYFAKGAPDIVQDYGPPLKALPTFGSLDRFLDVRFEQRSFLNPQDNLWFFFAGHGTRADGIDYLLPIDGNPNRIQNTGLPIHYVAERLRRCGAGNIVMMLDACRDGDSRDVGQGIGVEAHQGVVTLFSCGANEEAYEIEELQHGVFTYALLEGLRLEGSRNCATVDRLSQYVRSRVGELNKPKKRRQTPLVKAEPIEKLHLVLLPDKATMHDAAPLKQDAFKAEVVGNLAAARQLWIRVLCVIRADLDAIEALERLAVKRAELPQTAQTLGIGGERAIETPVEEAIFRAVETVVEPTIIQAKPVVPTFSFEVVIADAQGTVTNREMRQAEYRQEALGQGVKLDMMAIPGGTFQMGSAVGDGDDDERPQHSVTVKPFWMGKYQVTQAQWRAVAALSKVERNLEPEPSRFKGDRLPTEQVSWDDATEFCDRLSKHTGRAYRLPSEAEWEYACRAKTTTPFHFGDTLSSEIANYNADYTYGNGQKGEYRKKTTDVGSFPANAFGLYDMHGNVWEWCLDHWHENYAGAPIDGSAWLSSDENAARLLRGGSWDINPGICRSANRGWLTRDDRNDSFGFRVVCGSSWTLT